jgi:hypothetical protein
MNKAQFIVQKVHASNDMKSECQDHFNMAGRGLHMSPNAGEGRGGCGVSANGNSCATHVTWSPNKPWRANSIFNLCMIAGDDFVELPVPEQFKTRLVGGKLETTPTECA